MGTQQSGLTTRLFGQAPDVVFAHPIPEHLQDVEQLEWDSRDDVLRWLASVSANQVVDSSGSSAFARLIADIAFGQPT